MKKRKRKQYFRYVWVGMILFGVISGFFEDSNSGEFFFQKASSDPSKTVLQFDPAKDTTAHITPYTPVVRAHKKDSVQHH